VEGKYELQESCNDSIYQNSGWWWGSGKARGLLQNFYTDFPDSVLRLLVSTKREPGGLSNDFSPAEERQNEKLLPVVSERQGSIHLHPMFLSPKDDKNSWKRDDR
jgi:hypothetical protein